MDRAAEHKKAFREIFNALEELYPPDNTEQWWEKAHERIMSAYRDSGRILLAQHLCVAIFWYLDDVANGMNEQTEANTHNDSGQGDDSGVDRGRL